jgi:chromatin structure-remodeling complex subunit RSC58
MEFIANTEAPRTSIFQKFQSNKTRQKLGIYGFYHDFKLATITNLVKYPIGSAEYVAIYDLFKFFVDLVFREGDRLGFLKDEPEMETTTSNTASSSRKSLPSQPSQGQEEDNNNKELTFESEVFQGYKKIYADFSMWNGEAYYIVGQSGPLFSSLNGKAAIDPRETTVRGQFNTTKVVPFNTNVQPYQLAYVSPAISRTPHPSAPPTELMSTFTHPVESSLPHTKWLKFEGYSSFAPVRDDNGAILDNASSSAVWYEKFGQQKLLTAEEAEDEENSEEESSADEESLDEESSDEESANEESANEETGSNSSGIKANGTTELNGEEAKVADKSEPKDMEMTDVSDILNGALDKEDIINLQEVVKYLQPENGDEEELDLLSILEWNPSNFIDEDEIEAAKEGTEQELLSKLLLQLQQLQRVRLASNENTVFDVQPEERRLAFKIQNMLARIVSDTTPKSLDLAISSNLPVLQVSYPGTLPSPDLKQFQPQRLSSLNRNAAVRALKLRR